MFGGFVTKNRWKAGATILGAVLAALALGACGSGGDGTTVAQPPPIAPDTAAHLAKLSDRVASELDSGDTCHAAHTADSLRSAMEDADLPASMSSDVDAVAGRLVDEVNCPPPPPPPEPKKKKEKKDEKHEEHGDEEHGDENKFKPPGHAKHGGIVPPGHAKLEGE
jgi:hypothetical protein